MVSRTVLPKPSDMDQSTLLERGKKKHDLIGFMVETRPARPPDTVPQVTYQKTPATACSPVSCTCNCTS